MAQIFEHFVVCGIGPEIRTLDGGRGFHGFAEMYLPSLLDQFPPANHTLYPPPPPQLPTCVLPAGVSFYSSGFDAHDATTFPRSYPIVLTGMNALSSLWPIVLHSDLKRCRLLAPSVLTGKDPKSETLTSLERAGLWLHLLKLGPADDPLSSFEYGTILALIESGAEGIGGSGFLECIREHTNSGWHCQLTEEQFIAVKELAQILSQYSEELSYLI